MVGSGLGVGGGGVRGEGRGGGGGKGGGKEQGRFCSAKQPTLFCFTHSGLVWFRHHMH